MNLTTAMNSGQFSQSKLVDRIQNFVIAALVVSLVAVTSVLLHVIFAEKLNDLTIELLAAVVGVCLVIVSVAITIFFQASVELRREFNVEVFKSKLEVYTSFVETVAEADDDAHVSNDEVAKIYNRARMISLFGPLKLVQATTAFVTNVDKTGEIYIQGDEDKGTLRNVIMEMRNDLGVAPHGDDEEIRAQIRELAKGMQRH